MIQALTTMILARQVLRQVGGRYGVSAYDLRTLVAVSVLSQDGGRPTVQATATLLALTDNEQTYRSVGELRRLGYLTAHGKRGDGRAQGLRVEASGVKLLSLLEREERAARAAVAKLEVGKWKRSYVKSGKHVGRWAKTQANKKARLLADME